jgi:transposase
MRETITMTSSDQRRTRAMTRLVAGELTVAEVAVLLGRSERSIWRLRRRYLELGVDAIVHGNRGRASPRRLAEATRTRILDLAATVYDGANDSHLAELLAERDGIVIGRSSLQRLLRSAGRASPRHRRAPRHRSRRDRMPQAGLLVQLDGSRHDWLAERGPRLTLVGGIDDATGIVTGATFRDQEDAAGYLVVLRDTVRRHGVPVAVYRDRHASSLPPGHSSDLAKATRFDLIDQAMDGNVLDPRMGSDAIDLGTEVIFQIAERMKGEIDVLPGLLDEVPMDGIVLERQHPAAGVFDDDDLLRSEKLLADDERTDRVVRREAAGIPDDVSVPRAQAEDILHRQASIHARQDRELATWR